MIAIDTNILVHAHRSESPDHARARSAIHSLIESGSEYAIPWPSVHEFLAVTTNRRVFVRPSTTAEALGHINALVDAGALLIHESPRHLETMRRITVSAGVVGGAVHDARIAAICIDYGVTELWTADRDFDNFPQLRTRNPLT